MYFLWRHTWHFQLSQITFKNWVCTKLRKTKVRKAKQCNNNLTLTFASKFCIFLQSIVFLWSRRMESRDYPSSEEKPAKNQLSSGSQPQFSAGKCSYSHSSGGKCSNSKDGAFKCRCSLQGIIHNFQKWLNNKDDNIYKSKAQLHLLY